MSILEWGREVVCKDVMKGEGTHDCQRSGVHPRHNQHLEVFSSIFLPPPPPTQNNIILSPR